MPTRPRESSETKIQLAPVNGPQMRHPFFHCPLVVVLFSLWPILHFANHNREQIDSAGFIVLVSIFGLTALAGCLGFLAANAIFRLRRPVAAAITMALFLTLFFNYHIIFDGLVDIFAFFNLSLGENYAYLALVVALCLLSLRYLNHVAVLQLVLAFGVVANLIPAVALTMFAFGASTYETTHITTRTSPVPFVVTPNIFHLITDGYARYDTLLRMTDFDNTGFLEALEQRRFYVARRSYSNYPATYMSIASTLSMDYVATESSEPFKSRIQFYEAIQGNNPVVAQLQSQGYRYIHHGATIWDGSKCSGREDLCLVSGKTIERAIVSLSPLRRFLRADRPSTVTDLDGILPDPLTREQPVYVFSHTFPPHPPRTFTSDCEEIWLRSGSRKSDPVGRLVGKANGLGPAVKTNWRDRRGYANDVKCTNEQLLNFVDGILSTDPHAVILVHADHGSAFEVNWNLPIDHWPEKQFEERFGILMALKFPANCANQLYPSISPVNIYRVLFACLAGKTAKLYPDISYVSPYEKHPQYGTAHPYRKSANGIRQNHRTQLRPSTGSSVNPPQFLNSPRLPMELSSREGHSAKLTENR